MSVTVSWFAPASPRGIITDYRVSVECGIGEVYVWWDGGRVGCAW